MAKLKELGELGVILAQHKRVALTTGAYDVPHIGHIRYLQKAKTYGDVLVLILHSDELISLRKGPDRPIRKEETRVRRIMYGNAYKCVDYLCIARTQQGVYDAIRTIQPTTLITSFTTEDDANSPEMMDRLFGATSKIVKLGAQATVHSTHIIERRGLVKA